MASPLVIFVAGMGTVVGALGLGFAGSSLLTSTTPVKEKVAAVRPDWPAPGFVDTRLS